MTQAAQLKNQKISLQKRGIMSKEFKVPDYIAGVGRNNISNIKSNEGVHFP